MSVSNGALPWFRMHTHILDNHKIHALPAEIFRTWVMLLALARRNGGVLPSVTLVTKSNDGVTKSVTKSVTGSVTLDAEKCAFALRCVTDIVTEHVTHLVTVGLIDVTEDGLVMHDWEEHQQEPGGIRKQALSNAERQRAFRERRAQPVTESNEKVTVRNGARNEKVTDASRARSESESVICSESVFPESRATGAQIKNNAPAREAGRNGARSVVVAAEVVSETDQEILQTAERLSSRHPSVRSCSVSVTRNLLEQICNGQPERERLPMLRRIDQCHERWCASGEWTRESGRYAKPLRKWLDPEQEAWTVDAPERDMNGAGPSTQATVKAMEIFLRSKNAR